VVTSSCMRPPECGNRVGDRVRRLTSSDATSVIESPATEDQQHQDDDE
jgi:hypothetical protein